MKERKLDLALGVGVLVIAALPRLWDLHRFITWDELFWTQGSIRFLVALAEGRLADTFVIGQPGVITLWLGALVQWLRTLAQPGAWAELTRLAQSQYQVHDAELLRAIARFWPGTPVMTALFTTVVVAGVYWLARPLLGRWPALLGALLLAFDPFFLAHSRVMALDGVLAGLMTLSLLSLLVSLQGHGGRGYLMASGLLAGLAALQKSPGFFLVPFSGLVMLAYSLRRPGGLRWSLRGDAPARGSNKRVVERTGERAGASDGAVWAVAAGLAYFAGWPALWVDPAGTLGRMVGTLTEYVPSSAEYGFFLGQPMADPGLGFYPAVLAFRLTPVVAGGVLVCLLYRWDDRPAIPFVLLTYAMLFGLFLSLVSVKFERYLLPIFPALDLLAAAGLVKLLDAFLSLLHPNPISMLHSLRLWLLVGLAAFQLASTLPYAPYYLSCYNPLAGGARLAPRVLPVGWGEGMDRVAEELNKRADAAGLVVAVEGMAGLAPLFAGRVVAPTPENLPAADYLVVYVGDVQQRLPLAAAVQGEAPETTIRLHGVEYAWVHRNTTDDGPLALIGEQGQPGDVILLATQSQFAKRYTGPVPVVTLPPDQDEEQVVALLAKLAAQHQRLWYVSYGGIVDKGAEWVAYQLAVHAERLTEAAFPRATVRLYRLDPSSAFRVTPRQELAGVTFGGCLALRTYGLAVTRVSAGRAVGVVLEWEGLQPMDRDYTAFVHLVDAQGRRWAQVERLLRRRGQQPTSGWRPGSQSLERYTLALPADIPSGAYWLQVGVYDARTGQELPGAEVRLGPVQMVGP